ncbi:MAG TPA: NHL repeat-containing protein [Oscillatoriaceae cyanobacterium]
MKPQFFSSLLLTALLTACQTASPTLPAACGGDRAFTLEIEAPRRVQALVARHRVTDIDHYLATLYAWDAGSAAYVLQPNNPPAVKPFDNTTIGFGNLGPNKYQVRLVGYDAGNVAITSTASATIDLSGNDLDPTPTLTLQPTLLPVTFAGKVVLPSAPAWATGMEAQIVTRGQTLADVRYGPGQTATATNLQLDTSYDLVVTASGTNGYSDTQTVSGVNFPSTTSSGDVASIDDTDAPSFFFNWPGYTVDSGPAGVAIDASRNHLWVACTKAGTVDVLDASGSKIGSYPVDPPDSVAVDSTSGDVWVLSTFAQSITALSPSGEVLGTASLGVPLGDMAADSNGHLWVTEPSASQVVELSTTCSQITGKTLPAAPAGVAVDGGGNVWIADGTGNSVTEYDTSGNLLASDTVAAGPQHLAVDPSSGNLWVVSTGGSGAIQQITPAGSVVVDIPGYSPNALAVSASGNVWFADTAHHDVVELDASGNVLKRYTGRLAPGGLAPDSLGEAWVSSPNSLPRMITLQP